MVFSRKLYAGVSFDVAKLTVAIMNQTMPKRTTRETALASCTALMPGMGLVYLLV